MRQSVAVRVERFGVLAVLVALLVTTLPAGTPAAIGAPIAADATSYGVCGRVFPDPQAYWPSPAALPTQSPWAKGNVACRAVTFLDFADTVAGLEFLASDEMFGDFVEVFDLSDPDGPMADALDFDAGDGMTAGLPQPDGSRDRSPMYLIRVTDEEDTTVAIEDREHFVYTLSIHGIERAGVEGGVRAIEDLATWGSCEKHGDDSPANCAQEDAGPDNPHPLLETIPDESISAGDALRQSAVYFVLSNPDGWRRGDLQSGGLAFQRYNGNGMDMNRDWPTIGNTYRPYTPLSEPENRTTARALKDIRDSWTGGIDLHGQLIDRAFSFTLIGGAQRPFDKDRRVLQFVQGAYADAETRLAWSPLIKPNDAPPACIEPGTSGVVNPPPDCDPTPRVYGVQYGTIWDTIAYTVTGALGDWIDSPIGLDADGIDNEMSLSHLANCVTGNCFLPDAEQLHVDGNKSLIYGMIHYSLAPEDTTFRYDGRVGYIANPRVLSDPGAELAAAQVTDLPRQDDIVGEVLTHDGTQSTFEFDVLGPDDGVHNGGLFAEVTFTNVGGLSGSALGSVAIDRLLGPGEEAPIPPAGGDDGWEQQNSYFNQAPTYLQAGARVDVNGPTPGRYRLRLNDGIPGQATIDIRFTEDAAWPDPGQVAFEVSNQDVFEMLGEFVASPDQLVPVSAEDLLAGEVDLDLFDTILAIDDAFLPGWRDADETERIQDVPPADDVFLDRYPDDNVDTRVTTWTAADRDAMAEVLRGFAEDGGNLVLTDDSLRGLEWMGLVPDGTVAEEAVYAGHVQFTTDAAGGSDETYDDPLAANVDLPGAAEGVNHRHQTVEPVPLGYTVQTVTDADAYTLPEWGVEQGAWEAAGGRTVGTLASGATVLGELPVGEGQVRIIGSLLPFPTDLYDHPFGLSSYALTFTGYEVLRNALDVVGATPAPLPEPDAGPDPVEPDPEPVVPDNSLPATGGGFVVAAMGTAAIAIGLRRRR